MKKFKYIIISISIIAFLCLSFTFAKFMSTKVFNLGYHLVGAKYNPEGLVNSDVNLNPSRELLVNPYRGFYILDSIHLPIYYADDDVTNEANRQKIIKKANSVVNEVAENSLSLILLEVYLEEYKDKDIPEYYINVLNEYIDIIKNAGYKIVLRFAYGEEYKEGENINNDPEDFNIILGHVEQLKDFFERNKDSLHIVQLGFIGPWGEMHSSPYVDTEHINLLTNKALECIPYPIQVALRRPSYYREFVGDNSFFDERLGYTNTKEARVGIFNDSFLSSGTDKGTYKEGQRESELEWQSYLTKYTVMGGELSYKGDETGQYPGDSENLFFEIPEATKEMEQVHLNYLHDGNKIIENFWKNTNLSYDDDPLYEGLDAYTYFANRAGYRFLITNAKVPFESIKKGGVINFEVTIKNEGFANLTHERNVYIILTKGDKYYKLETDKNPTTWWSGEETREEFVVKIPSNIQEGEWKIYLSLPDKFDTYANNNNAAIKFANEDGYLMHVLGNYVGTVNISGEADNNNNGFYQLNDAIEEVVDNSKLYKFERPVTLDGLLTDEYEWYETELIYDDGNVEIYARDDDPDYLYLIGQAYGFSVFDYNFHIHFAINDENRFDYMTENGRFYIGSYDNEGGIDESLGHTKIDLAQNEYFEYKIPKALLGIQSIKDIKKIRVDYLYKNWDKALSVDITDFKPSYSIVVDGMNTKNEWDIDDLVLDDGTSKIYGRQEGGYLFIYIDTSLVNNINSYNNYLYLAGASSSDPKDYNRTLTQNRIYMGNIDNARSGTAVGTYDYMIDEGIEYKIHIRDVDAVSISDIIGVSFVLRNKRTNEERVKIEAEFDKSLFSELVIDGYDNDWDSELIYHKTTDYITYLGNDKTFLYFYGEILDNLASDYDTIAVYFAIKGQSKAYNDYIYRLYNNEFTNISLYDSNYSVISDYKKAKGVEFKIDLSNFGIKSAEDVIGIRIEYRKSDETSDSSKLVYSYDIDPKRALNIVINGVKDENEWIDEYKYYANDEFEIYITNDTKYLYLYGNVFNTPIGDNNLQVRFAIKDMSTSASDYIYKLENKRIYLISSNSSIGKVADLATKDAFEYMIPLSSLGIKSTSQIIGVKITYLSLDWQLVTEYSVDPNSLDIKIDGHKGDNEWSSEDLYHSTSNYEIYMTDNNKYLYLYGNIFDYPYNGNYDVIQIFFAIKNKSNSSSNYVYYIEDSRMGSYPLPENESLVSVLESGFNEGFEYRLDMEAMGISSYSDIIGIRINYLNGSDIILNYDINPSTSFTIVMDGENTNGEYNDNLLINTSNYNIYALVNANNLYIYGEYKNITFSEMYLYLATKDAPIGDYNYRVNSSSTSIYRYANGSQTDKVSSSLIRSVKDNTFEFSLPISDLNIKSINDLKGLRISPRYLNEEGTKTYHFEQDVILTDKVVIDDENTEYTNKLIASNSAFDVYGFSSKDYLYIYTKFNDTFDNFHIYFATENIANYNYRISNGSLRDENTKVEINTQIMNSRTSNVIEYAIPLSNLGITSIDDIKSIKIEPLKGWDEAYKIDILDIKNGITIDGEITNENEYPPESLVGSLDGVELYINKVGDIANYLIKFDSSMFTRPRKNYTIYVCTEEGCSTSSRLARLENGKFRLLANNQSIDKSNYGYFSSQYIESAFLFSDIEFDINEIKYYEVRLDAEKDENGDYDRKTYMIPAIRSFGGS